MTAITRLPGDGTSIEWVLALARARNMRGDVWNPLEGCSPAGEGCRNCWAAREVDTRGRQSGKTGARFGGLTRRTAEGRPVFNGEVRLIESDLDKPLRTRTPTVYFVCSRSDLFHAAVPDEWRDRVFAVMALCPQHLFLALTKRPGRMREYLTANTGPLETGHACGRIADAVQPLRRDNLPVGPLPHLEPGATWWPLPHLWLGTSIWDQDSADRSVPELLATPAAQRFVSCEPLLGPVDLKTITPPGRPMDIMLPLAGLTWTWTGSGTRLTGQHARIDWVIAGGESGRDARPSHMDWFRSLRNQCVEACVPFFFKQWGEWGPDWEGASTCELCGRTKYDVVTPTGDCHVCDEPVDWQPATMAPTRLARVGKKAAGRLLDGREWLGVPG